jgi:hypothetical protein
MKRVTIRSGAKTLWVTIDRWPSIGFQCKSKSGKIPPTQAKRMNKKLKPAGSIQPRKVAIHPSISQLTMKIIVVKNKWSQPFMDSHRLLPEMNFPKNVQFPRDFALFMPFWRNLG